MHFSTSSELHYRLHTLWQRWRTWLLYAAISIVVAVLGVYFFLSPAGRTVEFAMMSTFYSIRGPIPPPEGVTIVAMDDQSFVDLKLNIKNPVPRKYIAEALERVAAGQPKLMMLDVNLVAEPGVDDEADSKIEAALRAVPSTIWSGEYSLNPQDRSKVLFIPSDERFRRAAGMELSMDLYGSNSIVVNIADIASKSPALADRIPTAYALTTLTKLKLAIPGSLDFINFYGPAGSLHSISLASLISGPALSADAQNLIKGKIVVMGNKSLLFARGRRETDEFDIPMSQPKMFGVEIHATAVGNLLEGSWLHRLGLPWTVLPLILSTMLMVFYALNRPSLRTLKVLTHCWIGSVVCSYLLFAYAKIWIDGVGCLAVLFFFTAILQAVYNNWLVDLSWKELKESFNYSRWKKT